MAVRIGYGFNSATNQVKPSGIFSSSAKTEQEDNIGGKLSYFSSVYKSSDDYKRNLSNSFSASAPIPVADSALELTLKGASDTKKNKASLIYVMRIVKIGRKENFVVVSPVLSDPNVQAELNKNKNELANIYNKFGDSYISSISYGKEVVIAIEFQNTDIETTKKIDSMLNLSMSNIINLQDIIALERVIKTNKISSQINVQVTGFKKNQLPPSLPNNIGELADWLKIIQNAFDNLSPADFTDALEYEVTPYSAILAGADVNVTQLSMKAFLIGQYLSSIQKCKKAIDVYLRYYEHLGDSAQILTNLQLYKQELISTENILNVNSNLADPLVTRKVKRLPNIIAELNKLNDQASKIVNNITSKNFGKDVIDFDIHNRRHISNPFQIYLDPALEINSFAFKVTNPENKLNGTLGLYYSTDKNIPFNASSQPIANNISIGNSTASVPDNLAARGFNNMFFGFHYDGYRSGGFDINKPLQIETSVKYKMPEEIYLEDLGDIEETIEVLKPKLIV